jgi:hypothetical protein
VSAVGELALWAALACALWGTVAAVLAERRADARFAESAMRAGIACALLLALADAGLTAMLLSADTRYAYAAATTAAGLPRAYRLAAFLSRPAGSVLGFAALTAVVAALAPREFRARPRASLAICAVLAVAILAILIIGSPFAPATVAASDGAGLDPDWHLPWTTVARAALLVFATALAIAKVRAIAGERWQRVSMAPAVFGAIALVCALRRSLAGPPWGALEWIALGVWLVTLAFARLWRWRTPVLTSASGIFAAIALAGVLMQSAQALSLADGLPVRARDPLGRTWTFVSDGRSIYTQLDRRVLAVFIETDARGGARPEWRIYVDAAGEGRAQQPVDAVLAGQFTYTAFGLLAPPAAGSASVRVRWVPFFAVWWVAVALFAGATIVSARREEST